MPRGCSFFCPQRNLRVKKDFLKKVSKGRYVLAHSIADELKKLISCKKKEHLGSRVCENEKKPSKENQIILSSFQAGFF
jgi:hypothetical protein